LKAIAAFGNEKNEFFIKGMGSRSKGSKKGNPMMAWGFREFMILY